MRTPQEIAREALGRLPSMSISADATSYLMALREISALPETVSPHEPVPFALPVNELRSIPVVRVDSAENCGISVRLWVGDLDYHVSPPYAAAWLRLFGLEKEASK